MYAAASAAALAVQDADEEMQWGSPEGLPRINPLQSQGSLRLRSQASLKAYEASALLRTASFKVHHTCRATGGRSDAVGCRHFSISPLSPLATVV